MTTRILVYVQASVVFVEGNVTVFPEIDPVTHVVWIPEANGQNCSATAATGVHPVSEMVIDPPSEMSEDEQLNPNEALVAVDQLTGRQPTSLGVSLEHAPGSNCMRRRTGVHPADARGAPTTCGVTHAPAAATPRPRRLRWVRRS
jgi:hypothetical protein